MTRKRYLKGLACQIIQKKITVWDRFLEEAHIRFLTADVRRTGIL